MLKDDKSISIGLPYCLTLTEFNSRYRFLADRYHPNRSPTMENESQEETKVMLLRIEYQRNVLV